MPISRLCRKYEPARNSQLPSLWMRAFSVMFAVLQLSRGEKQKTDSNQRLDSRQLVSTSGMLRSPWSDWHTRSVPMESRRFLDGRPTRVGNPRERSECLHRSSLSLKLRRKASKASAARIRVGKFGGERMRVMETLNFYCNVTASRDQWSPTNATEGKVQFKRLGETGLLISEIGFGASRLGGCF